MKSSSTTLDFPNILQNKITSNIKTNKNVDSDFGKGQWTGENDFMF